jgi:hypothetical protein
MEVCLFISGDVGVSWDSVDLGCNAMHMDIPHPAVDPPRKSVAWAWLQGRSLQNCVLLVAEDCYCLHSMILQYFSLLERHVKGKSDLRLFEVRDLHSSGAQNAVGRSPSIS